jgi:putative FmdB family regulatory protein
VPLNDYHCPKCDTLHEIVTDHGEIASCPQCGCAELEKKFPLSSHRWGKGVSVDNPKRMWHGLPTKEG